MLAAYRVEMLESEAGWGTRPDGYIYGATKEAVETALKKVAAAASYEEYSRPNSDIVLVEVNEDLYDKLHCSDGPTLWTPVGKHAGDLTRK
jgi:hypothetical protein